MFPIIMEPLGKINGVSQEIKIEHVPDKSMPADFLTKWIGASKLNISVVRGACHECAACMMAIGQSETDESDWGECWMAMVATSY